MRLDEGFADRFRERLARQDQALRRHRVDSADFRDQVVDHREHGEDVALGNSLAFLGFGENSIIHGRHPSCMMAVVSRGAWVAGPVRCSTGAAKDGSASVPRQSVFLVSTRPSWAAMLAISSRRAVRSRRTNKGSLNSAPSTIA